MSVASSLGAIVIAMALLAALEAWIPLRARGAAGRAHLGPNLALTGLAFATNAVFSALLVAGLAWLQARELGLLNALAVPALPATAIALVALDLGFYATHVAMHKWPSLWRFHAVHHSDPQVDVTTTVRQHPGESAIRFVSTAAVAFALGVAPLAYGLYRTAVALNGLFEHANLRAPEWLDRALALVTTWPYLHKIHHSRDAAQTDTNYGNLLSLWDRLFGTYTPSQLGARVSYGLAGCDAAEIQSILGLLALPFRASAASFEGASTAYTRSILPTSSSAMESSERGA